MRERVEPGVVVDDFAEVAAYVGQRRGLISSPSSGMRTGCHSGRAGRCFCPAFVSSLWLSEVRCGEAQTLARLRVVSGSREAQRGQGVIRKYFVSFATATVAVAAKKNVLNNLPKSIFVGVGGSRGVSVC